MTGIFLIFVVLAWFCISIWLTYLATRRIKRKGLHILAGMFLFVALMIFPVADEIVGGIQFRALCEENSKLQIDVEKIKGRTVRVVISPSNEVTKKTMLPIYHSHLSFRDAMSDEELANYDRYEIKGGQFIHMLGISENDAPLIIHPAYCAPPDRGMLPKKYNFVLVN